MIRTSEDIVEISKALVELQKTIKNPRKNKKNTHLGASYADLESGLDILRPALTALGICVVQVPFVEGDNQMLTTRLQHESGQFFEGDYWVARVGAKHQEIGGALTYAKRQSLFSICGVCGEEDRDGEEGRVGAGRRGAPRRDDRQQPPREADRQSGRERLPPDQSRAKADEMIAAINTFADNRTAQDWAKQNKDTKDALQPIDSDRVSAAWTRQQAAISKMNAAADKRARDESH